jgi:hypothetical protein
LRHGYFGPEATICQLSELNLFKNTLVGLPKILNYRRRQLSPHSALLLQLKTFKEIGVKTRDQ